MKGLIALTLVLLLGLSASNYWEIRSMRQEIAALSEKVKVQSESNVATDVLRTAAATFVQARELVNKVDTVQARTAYESAKQRLEAALKTANDKAGPAGKWVRDEAYNLGKQLQESARSH